MSDTGRVTEPLQLYTCVNIYFIKAQLYRSSDTAVESRRTRPISVSVANITAGPSIVTNFIPSVSDIVILHSGEKIFAVTHLEPRQRIEDI